MVKLHIVRSDRRCFTMFADITVDKLPVGDK